MFAKGIMTRLEFVACYCMFSHSLLGIHEYCIGMLVQHQDKGNKLKQTQEMGEPL